MAESTEIQDVKTAQPDDDLDNLLDSALDDFNQVPKDKPIEKEDDEKKNNEGEEMEDMWSEIMKQAFQIEPNIREMFQQGTGEENAFVKDFSKIAEAAAKVMETDCPRNFADIMSETLKNLNENSETIQNQFGNPEELANLFQELGLNGGMGSQPEGSLEDLPPFILNMMQSYLSKDLLYPSMKEFVEKYPVWLEEHKESLSEEEFSNYSKQLELMKKIVEEFEAESESDSEEVKNQRFQRIMGYLQQMHSLGHPPAELFGGASIDEAAMPNLPPGMDPHQCSMM